MGNPSLRLSEVLVEEFVILGENKAGWVAHLLRGRVIESHSMNYVVSTQ